MPIEKSHDSKIERLVRKADGRLGYIWVKKIPKLKEEELKELKPSHVFELVRRIERVGRLEAVERLLDYAIKKRVMGDEEIKLLVARLVNNMEKAPSRRLSSAKLLVFLIQKDKRFIEPFMERLNKLANHSSYFVREDARMVLNAIEEIEDEETGTKEGVYTHRQRQ